MIDGVVRFHGNKGTADVKGISLDVSPAAKASISEGCTNSQIKYLAIYCRVMHLVVVIKRPLFRLDNDVEETRWRQGEQRGEEDEAAGMGKGDGGSN